MNNKKYIKDLKLKFNQKSKNHNKDFEFIMNNGFGYLNNIKYRFSIKELKYKMKNNNVKDVKRMFFQFDEEIEYKNKKRVEEIFDYKYVIKEEILKLKYYDRWLDNELKRLQK